MLDLNQNAIEIILLIQYKIDYNFPNQLLLFSIKNYRLNSILFCMVATIYIVWLLNISKR